MNRQSRLFFFVCSLLRLPASIAFVGTSRTAPLLPPPVPSAFGTPLQKKPRSRNDESLSSRLLASPRTFSTSPLPSGSAASRRRQQGGGGQQKPPQEQQAELQRQGRRRVLLSRSGPHFQLNRFSGQIEFGATAQLTTKLSDATTEVVNTWLKDERGMAMSIWDEKLTTDLGNHVYRLQIMTLQFVTLQLSPSVDVRMKTVMMMMDDNQKQQQQQPAQPVFTLDSVNFDPNIEFLPGMKISAESLGIVIEVAGEMRALPNGQGVSGQIAFQTSGSLPPPMRILPDAVLKAASDSINETVANFAIASFQRGAREQFRAFVQKQQQQQRNEQEQNN
jgi:Protein of unknown function (DUF1997)